MGGLAISQGKRTTTDHKLPPVPRVTDAPSRMGYHTLDLPNQGLF